MTSPIVPLNRRINVSRKSAEALAQRAAVRSLPAQLQTANMTRCGPPCIDNMSAVPHHGHRDLAPAHAADR